MVEVSFSLVCFIIIHSKNPLSAHLRRLFGKWFTHLYNHVFIRLVVCSHVNAGNPLFHGHIKRLATIIRRSSALACTFPPAHPSFGLEMLHTLGAQGTSSAIHDDTVSSHVSAWASCEQWRKCVPASVKANGETNGRGREGGASPVAQQVGEINAAFTTIGNTISTINVCDHKHTILS